MKFSTAPLAQAASTARRAVVDRISQTPATRLALRLLREEEGSEILEYVLIAGLIIVGTITTIAFFGTRVANRWSTVTNSSL